MVRTRSKVGSSGTEDPPPEVETPVKSTPRKRGRPAKSSESEEVLSPKSASGEEPTPKKGRKSKKKVQIQEEPNEEIVADQTTDVIETSSDVVVQPTESGEIVNDESETVKSVTSPPEKVKSVASPPEKVKSVSPPPEKVKSPKEATPNPEVNKTAEPESLKEIVRNEPEIVPKLPISPDEKVKSRKETTTNLEITVKPESQKEIVRNEPEIVPKLPISPDDKAKSPTKTTINPEVTKPESQKEIIRNEKLAEQTPETKEETEKVVKDDEKHENGNVNNGKETKLEDSFEDDDIPVMELQRQKDISSRSCPYLDTINRHVLDFDFEKLCSVSLSHVNVYACLVCGKYFQGRGKGTYAFTHSVDIGHRVMINLGTLKFYCLPDNYEIIDSSLEDIRFVLNPTFTKQNIKELDNCSKLSRAVEGATYRPGLMGLNNIKANDYCNVVFHALISIAPLRDYFLREENYKGIKRPVGDILSLLPHRFGELVRKLWNPRAFKNHVSPHEMLQAVVLCSKKQFQFTKQSDGVELLSWLLNTLHIALNGNKKTSSSIVYKTLRGRMRVYSRKVVALELSEAEQVQLLQKDEYKETEEEAPFLYLTLDLPPAPVHRDELLQNVIPQVPLGQLLNKFNGTAEKEYKTYRDNIMKRFVLTRLPQYLIVCIKRFTKNNWFVEKNPTIVNFPIKNVDLFDCLAEDAQKLHQYTTYDLLANIVHDGTKSAEGTYRCQLLHKASNKWFELEDLNVKEILPQMITLTESYIQVWELNTAATREERKDEAPEVIDKVEVSTK